jgi:hypothetical protein
VGDVVAGDVVAGDVVTVPALDPVLAVLFAHTNLLPVFLHIYVTPLVFCVLPTLLHLPPAVAAFATVAEPTIAAPTKIANAATSAIRFSDFT